jgi:SHS2 domain-containing protein
METQILNKQHRHFNKNMDRIDIVKPQVTIQIEANSLRELFKKSLRSLANKLKYKIYNPTRHADCTMKIEVDAMNSEKLLKKFLNKVLELTFANHTIFCTMYIEELNENRLNAQLFGNWFDKFDKKIKYVPENGILMRSETDPLNPFTSSIIFKCEEDF